MPRSSAAGCTRENARRADRAVGRDARATSAARSSTAARRDAERALRALARRCSAIASTSSCSALGRPDEESYIAAAVALAGRRGVPVVATNDVRFLKPDDFEAHEARVCIHDGALLADPSAAAPLHAAAVPAHAAGDGGAVRRPARGAREHGRDRAPLQPGAEARQGAPAGVSGARRRSPSKTSCARKRARGLGSALRRRRRRRAATPALRERLRARARRHLQMGFAGLLPDRRRLHQLGARERRAGRARAAARAPARWSPTRSASPTSIRCDTTCCSSAS